MKDVLLSRQELWDAIYTYGMASLCALGFVATIFGILAIFGLVHAWLYGWVF